ncbi:MAG: acylphosphatase [Microcoleaceae cyanobacterium]
MTKSTESSLLRAHIFISGQVQGVGFRIATQAIAIQHNLQGWVRNLSDGRVEAVCEGNRLQIEAMIQWCRQGPPGAIPQTVIVEYEEPEGIQGFKITRRESES